MFTAHRNSVPLMLTAFRNVPCTSLITWVLITLYYLFWFGFLVVLPYDDPRKHRDDDDCEDEEGDEGLLQELLLAAMSLLHCVCKESPQHE